MVAVFREVRRVLRDDGTLWLNLGDSYAMSSIRGGNKPFSGNVGAHAGYERGSVKLGSRSIPLGLKQKDLIGIPWMVAFALRADGWYLRSDIIWHKPNPMPESVTDRPTKSHEYIFLLTKSARYYYDNEAVKEPVSDVSLKRAEYGWDCDRPSTKNASMGGDGIHVKKMGERFVNPAGRNKRSVWTVNTKPFKGAHFATFPPKLIEPCILAGTSAKGCCPKCGAGWVRVVERDTEQPEGYGNMGANAGKWIDEDKQSSGHRIQKNMNALRAAGRNHDNPFPVKITTGWSPACECNAGEPVPGVVLDPFNGAGTTGVVAIQHGRRYIGIDLNSGYLDMARKRIQSARDSITTSLF